MVLSQFGICTGCCGVVFSERLRLKKFSEQAGNDGFPVISETPSFYDRLLRILTALRYCQAVWEPEVKRRFEESLIELASNSRWKNSVRITAADMIGYMFLASNNQHAVKPTISKDGQAENWGFTYSQIRRVLESFIDAEFSEYEEAILGHLNEALENHSF